MLQIILNSGTTKHDNGPLKEKLKVNNRTNLALTTVLIMGSAGMTVVYVLCVFILCMRNEETQTNDDREELQHHLNRHA